MDGRGRIAQSLTWIARLRARPPTGGDARARACASRIFEAPMPRHRLPAAAAARLDPARCAFGIPRGAGIAAAIALMLGGLGYGVVKGDHVAGDRRRSSKDVRDQAANAVGFRIVDLAVTGQQPVDRGRGAGRRRASPAARRSCSSTSTRPRERLKTNPWIADATVRKLYPGELQIGIKEREPFALWQKDRRVSVIADDGTVLEAFVAPQLLHAAAGGRPRRRDARQGFPRAARPLSRDPRSGARLDPGRRAPLESAAEATASTSACPKPRSPARSNGWSTLDREAKLLTRDIVVDRPAARRPRDRAAVARRPRRRAQEQVKDQIKKGKKGGRA